MPEFDLTKLSFGAPAAERDINQGLIHDFVESDSFAQLQARKKTLVLGNRGVGKSALFKVLADRERDKNNLVLELAPENYSYEILSQHMASEAQGSWAKQGAYAAAWKYLIYVLVMKAITKAGPSYKSGSAAKIYNFLRDNFKGEQSSPIGILVSYLKRMEGIKIGTYESTVKTRELTSLYRLEEVTTLMPAIDELCQKRKVVILVDELDRGWDASEDAKAFVAGLVQAALSVNDQHQHLTVFVSLRKELYDSIPSLYEDAQKYRDVMETVAWEEESLLSLVAKRVRHTVPKTKTLSDAECWNAVFAETLQYRQTKSFNYIVDRTLYRPREIIQFCTDCLEEARRGSAFPIDYHVISHSEASYSTERAKDIAAEYRFQYPGLLSLFEAFRGSTYSWSREDLDEFLLRIAMGDIKLDKSVTWVLDQEPDFLLDVLWRVGFFRALAVGGIKALRRSGSQYVGPHQVDSLSLHNIQRLSVHQMFRAGLGMKETRDVPSD
jgi:hypothetical protein